MVSFCSLPHYRYGLFPHISRKFTARVKKHHRNVLPGVIFLIFLVSMLCIRPVNASSGLITQAENVFSRMIGVLCSSFGFPCLPEGTVQGAKTEWFPFVPKNTGTKEEYALYEQWKQIVAQKPDYREAYIFLTKLAISLSRLDEARVYAERAYLMDPNNTDTEHLREQIGEMEILKSQGKKKLQYTISQ